MSVVTSIECSNTAFGRDPVPGVGKQCMCSDVLHNLVTEGLGHVECVITPLKRSDFFLAVLC